MFKINLDTHLGDLSDYDVPGNSSLTNDRNETLNSGFAWKEVYELKNLAGIPTRRFEWRFTQ